MKIFAYGSNMHLNRLRKRVPSATKTSNAYIAGYTLKCNKISKDGSTKGNIVRSDNPKDIIWGVIFEIDSSEKANLDTAEGLGKGYNEITLVFTDTNNNNQEAQVYIADESFIDNETKPYDWYRLYILEGAKQNELSQDYIKKIAALEFETDNDEKRRQQQLKMLREGI